MNKLTNLIEHIFTKKNIKIFLFVFIFLGFFVGNSFAAGESNTSKDLLDVFSYLLNLFISMLSWIWIVFAVLAGKLMTNDLVYGSFINMDKVLRLLRNIMKNFANFALGFFFIFSIAKTLFVSMGVGKSQQDPMTSAKDTVQTTLIAGILIQMSRFLVGATIDISTVATAAVSSLPSQFISSSDSFKGKLQSVLTDSENGLTPKTIEVDLNNNTVENIIKTGVDLDVNKLLDTLVPSADSVAGPFMFLGVSIFDITTLSVSNYSNGSFGDWKDLFMDLGISGFVIFTFTIMLALITLFNLFRVITLWIIIPTMPLIILLHFLLKGKSSKLMQNMQNSSLSGVTDIKNLFTLVFKPVYMVLVLSIVLIVLSMIKGNVINKSQIENLNTGILITQTKDNDKYRSQVDLPGVVNIDVNGLKNGFTDLLVYIFGLIMMFFLMKSCFSKNMTGIKFIDEKIGNISESIRGKQGELGGILGSVGVIPMGGGMVGLGTFKEKVYDRMVNDDGTILSRRLLGNDYASEQEDYVNKWLGIDQSNGFDSLSSSSNSTEWIKRACNIGWSRYSRDSTGYVRFTSDDNYKAALRSWNTDTHPNDPINAVLLEDCFLAGNFDPLDSNKKEEPQKPSE